MSRIPLSVAIVGCGVIGRKRADALGRAGGRLLACADAIPARAETLARKYGGIALSNWREACSLKDVEAVIAATSNDALADVAIGALEAGRHVLLEKPAARNSAEIERVLQVCRRANKHVRVGFNHRYHPAFLKAFELLKSGVLGRMMFVRAGYGHGGRIGYEKEWRMNPAVSGGGELIDQGVHLIDLARMFLGEFSEVSGLADTMFWNTQADDNAFMTLRTAAGQVAFLHVSCTEWKNSFSFEVYGRNGKLHITGLGGSYGTERLAHYRMTPEMGPPETTIWEYPPGDNSWALELAEFVRDIRSDRPPTVNLADALAAMRVVEAIYKQSGGF